MNLKNKGEMIFIIILLLAATNACTYIICSWDQPVGESNCGAKTEVLIYIPPHEKGEECQSVDFSHFTMPYYSPVYEDLDSSERIVDSTLITSGTIYNSVPINQYCGCSPPFE